MSKNKDRELTPLQQLRLTKGRYKKKYLQDGENLTKNWNYLSNNTGSVLLSSIFSSSKKMIDRKSDGAEGTQTPFGQIDSFSSILSAVSGSFPIIWEVVQPMLISFAIKKIKGIFSSKKKKKAQ